MRAKRKTNPLLGENVLTSHTSKRPNIQDIKSTFNGQLQKPTHIPKMQKGAEKTFLNDFLKAYEEFPTDCI